VLGIEPNKYDTDDDGLRDGEEVVVGWDGFITDPLNPDTDSDGVNDSQDDRPLDGSTSTAGAAPDEPVVRLERYAVLLTEEFPGTAVRVTNSGGGVLGWTACCG
jgi:hypothetical protein